MRIQTEKRKKKEPKCIYCRELKKERYRVMVSEVSVESGYYYWRCPIHFCPYCGKKVKGEKLG